MIIQYIALRNEPDYSVSIGPLDGATLVLRIRWNMRAGWTVSCSDETDNPIFGVKRLAEGVDLLDGHRHDPRVPGGRLVLVDTSGLTREPGFGELASGPTDLDLRGDFALLYEEQ